MWHPSPAGNASYTGSTVGSGTLSRALRLIAVIVLLGGSGCSFIPAYTAPTDLRAATLLPADTWFFSEVTLRPSLTQLGAATRLANAFTSQPGWDAYVQQLSGTAGVGSENLLTDALTLLDGEVAVGIFGALPTGSGATPSFTVLAHASNPDRLVQMLAEPGLSATPPTKDARGANVYTFPGPGNVATFQNWLVIASSQTILDDTLGRISGGTSTTSLNDQPRFKALLNRLPSDRLGLQYLDTGALLRSVRSEISGAQRLSPQEQALLGDVESQVATSLAASWDGLDFRIESTTRLPPELAGQANLSAQLADADAAFAHLPADTLVALGTGLPMIGPQLDDAIAIGLQQAAQQLDAPELAQLDIHPSQWLVGPVALGGNAGTLSEPGGAPDVFLVAQVGDADAARADLNSVTALLPPKTATPLSIAGSTFVQVPLSEGQSLAYGVADNWLYAGNGDLQKVVESSATGGLTANPRYAALHAALGQDSVNLFVDIAGARDLAESMLDPREQATYESMARPLLMPLSYFGGGARSDANGDGHAHFILGIAA